jgi:hypothetical protein
VLNQSCHEVWKALVSMYRHIETADNCFVTFVSSYASRGSHTPGDADDPCPSIDPVQLLFGLYILKKTMFSFIWRNSPQVLNEILKMTFPILGDGWVNNSCLYVKVGGAYTLKYINDMVRASLLNAAIAPPRIATFIIDRSSMIFHNTYVAR